MRAAAGSRVESAPSELPLERTAGPDAPNRGTDARDSPREASDATAQRLDDFWDRRERWLSDRLGRR
jgi:hypothetical protein